VAGKPPESRWSVKIADIGISKHIPPEGKWDLTLGYYIAPELQGLVNPCQENPGSMDMWSLGIIVYFLATKQYPFEPRELFQFCHNDRKFPFQRQPMLKRWSGGGLAFVEALLRPLPRDRLSAEEALRHPWITSMSEEPARFSTALTTSESILSVTSPQEVDQGLVSGDQRAVSEHSKTLASVAPRHPQTPQSIQSTPLRLEQSQTTSYPRLIIPHWLDSLPGPLNASHPRRAFTPNFNGMIASYVGQTYRVASPGPLPPLRVNPPPTSFAKETPPVGGGQNCLSHFTPPNSPPAQSEPRMPLQRLERRATAPTPSRLIEDAIDLISPRTERTEAPGPVWEDQFAQEEASDSTSSSIEMSLTNPLNSPSPAPPSTTSLVWRDPRLMRLSRSMSDSFVQSSYASSSTDREWRRASAVEFVNDPRFRDSVHALYHAIVSGRDGVVELLLDAGVDIETVFRDPLELQKGTALHLAITRGRIDVAEVLLRRGACLTAKAEAKLHFQMKSLEPLHLAAFYGFEKIACMLLARGARIEANATGNFRDRKRRTPLHLAVLGEDPDEVPRMVRLLLQHGADPNVKDTLGMRPGDYAVMVGRKSLTADLPASSLKTIKAKVTKVRSKLEPLALAAPLLFGVGVAMILK
jgi:serine/threonine protein kinase